MVTAVLVDELGQFHVVTAVLGDFQEASVLEPAYGLQPFGGFFHAKSRGGDGIEREAVVQPVLQVHHQVERRQLREIKRGVPVQHFVVEPQVVEADHEVGALQVAD